MFHTSKSKFLYYYKKDTVSKEKKKNGGNMLIKQTLVYKKVIKHMHIL